MGIFEDLFDLNGDSLLNDFERSMDFCAFLHILDSEKKEELIMAGFDIDELENMDEYERREAIEDAGLDPDDYFI